MQSQIPAIRRIIRLRAVRERTSLSKSTLRSLEAAGQFPRRIQLGPRATGWYEDEVSAWIDSLQRKGGPGHGG
jgi:prophage regulatory protein